MARVVRRSDWNKRVLRREVCIKRAGVVAGMDLNADAVALEFERFLRDNLRLVWNCRNVGHSKYTVEGRDRTECFLLMSDLQILESVNNPEVRYGVRVDDFKNITVIEMRGYVVALNGSDCWGSIRFCNFYREPVFEIKATDRQALRDGLANHLFRTDASQGERWQRYQQLHNLPDPDPSLQYQTVDAWVGVVQKVIALVESTSEHSIDPEVEETRGDLIHLAKTILEKLKSKKTAV